MTYLGEAAVVLASYLLGCLNTGYYLVRWRTGSDVRRQGSGVTGAANTRRVLGTAGFLATLLGDLAKGAAAVALATIVRPGCAWLPLLALLAVIAGHLWPAQLRFRGGKGAATALGGMLVLDLRLAAALLLLFPVALPLVRRPTPAGLLVIVLSPAVAALLGRPLPVVLAALLAAALVLFGHRANLREIGRAWRGGSAGEEPAGEP